MSTPPDPEPAARTVAPDHPGKEVQLTCEYAIWVLRDEQKNTWVAAGLGADPTARTGKGAPGGPGGPGDRVEGGVMPDFRPGDKYPGKPTTASPADGATDEDSAQGAPADSVGHHPHIAYVTIPADKEWPAQRVPVLAVREDQIPESLRRPRTPSAGASSSGE